MIQEKVLTSPRFLRIAIFGIIVLSLLFIALLMFRYNSTTYSKQQDAASKALAYQMAQITEKWLTRQVQFAELLASFEPIRHFVEQTQDPLVNQHASKLFQGIHAKTDEYTDFTIISFIENKVFSIHDAEDRLTLLSGHALSDSIGSVDLASNTPLKTLSNILDSLYVEAIRGGAEVYIGEPERTALPDVPYGFVIAVPIKINDTLVGCLAFTIKLSALSSIVQNTTADQLEIFELIDDRGLYLSHRINAKILSTAKNPEVASLLQAIKRNEKAFLLKDNRGISWFYGIAKIEHPYFSVADWYAISRRNANIYFDERLGNVAIIIGGFCILFVALVFIGLYMQRLRERIFKDTFLEQEAANMRLYGHYISCGVIVLDEDFFFVSVNPVALDMLGYKGQNVIGTSFRTFFGEVANNRFLSDLIAGNQVVLRDVMVVALDGSRVFVDLLVNALLHDEQQYIITVLPVPATRELEEHMRAIYAASPDVYFIFSPSGEVLDCSDSAVAFFDAPKDKILANFFSFSPEKQSNGVLSIKASQVFIEQALDLGAARFYWDHKTQAGTLIPCEITLIVTAHNEQTTLIACVRDMRVQKQSEEALQKEQNLLRKTFDAIPGNVSLRDASLRYVAVNEAFLNLFHVEADGILGKRDEDIFDADVVRHMKLSDARACAFDDVVFEEYIFDTSQEDAPIYSIGKKALRTPTGEFDGILCMVFDISSQKMTESELIEAKVKAEASSRSKTAFLSNISHEIRTPMNAIIGFIQLFSRDNLDTRQCGYLDKVKDAADTLLSVINGVLELSKIEAGKLELEHILFSPRNLVETLINITTFSANEKYLPFEVSLSENLPESLVGDPTRIKQILLNLINNAIKFTAEGHVMLSVDTLESDTLPDTHIQIAFIVHDTGIGMSDVQLERIFKPFTQADASTTRKYGGTGLGLTICKQLAEMMGGDITVQSVLGSGTSFMLVLPLEQTTLVVGESCPLDDHERNKSIKGLKVLLVEDNLINQEIATAILEREDLIVNVAENGVEAIEAARCGQYDIIFMDMQMPVMDGLEATTRLRNMGNEENENAWLATVPIIAMTANAMLEDKQRCLKAGMNDHIAKPFEAEDVYRVIRHYS